MSAAYLAKAGKSVCVLERRHVLGGAAVTEEMVPGLYVEDEVYCWRHVSHDLSSIVITLGYNNIYHEQPWRD